MKIKKRWTKVQIKFKKDWWTVIGRIADIWWVLALILMVRWWTNLSNKITIIDQKIDWNTAESTLLSYFSEIENNNFTGAYSLLSEEFKQQGNDYEGFYNRPHNVVGFEGLRFTELTWKNTAIQKVYLVEFGFKERGKIPLETKRWMYVRYKDWKWEINSNSVLYENWRSKTSCKFYDFNHCK